MTTLRIARRRQYVQMDTRSVEDDRLSFRARGVLAWLLAKPDGWTVNADAIARQGKEGRDAIRTALSELEACGYLVRRQYRDDGGVWRTEATVYEHPEAVDRGWKTAAVEPQRLNRSGKPGALVKNLSKEPQSSSSSSARTPTGTPPAVTDDDEFLNRASWAASLLILAAQQQAGFKVRRKAPWLRQCAENWRNEHRSEVAACRAEHPNVSPEKLAEELETLVEVQSRRATHDTCACAGCGWVDVGDGTVRRCEGDRAA